MLKKADEVSTKSFGRVTVRELIGRGGQGSVFLVDGDRGEKALKWYNASAGTDQLKNLRALEHKGCPSKPPSAGMRFIWPLEVIESDQGFGYLMDLFDSTKTREALESYEPQYRDINLAI